MTTWSKRSAERKERKEYEKDHSCNQTPLELESIPCAGRVDRSSGICHSALFLPSPECLQPTGYHCPIWMGDHCDQYAGEQPVDRNPGRNWFGAGKSYR